MSQHEIRSASENEQSGWRSAPIVVNGFSLLPAAPTWRPSDGRLGDYGSYCNWQGIADDIERDLTPPCPCPVIVEGRNGSGKDALALEMARRLGRPFYLTALGPQTTNMSLIMTPILPVESRQYALTGHTTAQLLGGLSVLTEAGKCIADSELPFTAQSTAYDGHGVLLCDPPSVPLQIHPDHALMLLVLPGERVQADIASRAAFYRLDVPPPDVLIEIVKANISFQHETLLDALSDLVSEHAAAGRSITPRAAHRILAIGYKAFLRGTAHDRLTAKDARKFLDQAAQHVIADVHGASITTFGKCA